MPIYEYTCKDCESQFEKFVRSMNAEIEIQCPHCGGSHVKKGWSVFGTGLSLGALNTSAASSCNTGST